jgi:uncharacterized protein (DUF983 family)
VAQTGSVSSPSGHRRASNEAGRHWARLLGRGLTKRCPRCGGRRIYDSWFRMKDRCPTCGMRFEREPGFFVGAYLINFAISIVALFVLCMAFVAVKASDADAGYVGFLVAGFIIAIVLPVFCYPFSRTIWSAIDIGMTPLEPTEEAEAATAAAAREATTGAAPDDPPEPMSGPPG